MGFYLIFLFFAQVKVAKNTFGKESQVWNDAAVRNIKNEL